MLDRLAADVLAQRSVPLEIAFPHGAADRPLFVAARPFWQTLHVPQRARLCRCHQRDALVCASLRTLPCLQSPTARAVRIGTRAHVVSDDAAGHSIASSPTEDYRHRATIVGYVSLRGLHPAVMAGEVWLTLVWRVGAGSLLLIIGPAGAIACDGSDGYARPCIRCNGGGYMSMGVAAHLVTPETRLPGHSSLGPNPRKRTGTNPHLWTSS